MESIFKNFQKNPLASTQPLKMIKIWENNFYAHNFTGEENIIPKFKGPMSNNSKGFLHM